MSSASVLRGVVVVAAAGALWFAHGGAAAEVAPTAWVTAAAMQLPRATVCDSSRWDASTVSIRAFGATGSDPYDDYDALQAAAAFVSSHPYVTLVFPPGIYHVDRHVEPGSTAGPIEFRGAHDFHVVGCNATIWVQGGFVRRAVHAPGESSIQSPAQTVTPFSFVDCARFTLQGFELDGDVQQMQRDPGVVEGNGMGVSTSGCSDYAIADMYIHHFATDGLYLGAGLSSPWGGVRADQRAAIQRVTSAYNARSAMSIIQLRGAVISDSSFIGSGRTGGAYGGHSPEAGVDIEPDEVPPRADTLTGDLTFERCRFEHNAGSQVSAAYRMFVDSVSISSSIVTADPDSSNEAVILAVRRGVLSQSTVDTALGAIYPSWSDGGSGDDPATYPLVNTTLLGNTIHTKGAGIIDALPRQNVLIEQNLIVGQQDGPLATYMPYLESDACTFRGNHVVLSHKAYRPYDASRGLAWDLALLLEVGASSGNQFSTDLTPAGGAQFVVSYGKAAVTNDTFESAPAIAPCEGSAFRNPYSSTRP